VQHVPDALLIPNAALRFTPETATDTTVSRRDGLVGRLLPRMPARGDRRQAPAATDTKRAWILRDGQPAAIDVRAGVTDGVDTQIVAGNLPVGTAVIVDSTTARQ
jgi:HlyD family secretion protein